MQPKIKIEILKSYFIHVSSSQQFNVFSCHPSTPLFSYKVFHDRKYLAFMLYESIIYLERKFHLYSSSSLSTIVWQIFISSTPKKLFYISFMYELKIMS